MQLKKRQELALMLLRVTIGMLMVWWGLAKILTPDMGVGISKKFYLDLFSDADLQYMFGWFQLVIGLCVVLGFMRKYAVPAQLAITGLSSLAIWNALIDPFALFLPVEKVAGVQHLFYPSAIILTGGFLLLMLRDYDRFCLDRLLAQRRASLASSFAG